MTAQLDRDAFFIAGTWAQPSTVARHDVVEAATGKVLGTSPLADRVDIDAAVLAAHTALHTEWGATTGTERAALLRRLAGALQARMKDTATLVSRENGMPRQLSIGTNGYFPSLVLNYYADLAERVDDVDTRVGMLSQTQVLREPVGVVAAITPWNYPMGLAAMKIAPALAAGCTVILKAPPEAALDAFVWADAALEAGLPAGVLNIVPGDREAGAYLVGHPLVDKVAFTGSTAAGRAVGEICGRLLRPVTLELGGKSAAILADDADLDVFLDALLDVCLPNNGQTCHASTRILAPQSTYEAVVAAVTDRVNSLRVGDPLDKTTQVGPLVSAAQRQRVLGYIESGRAAGARLTTGGAADNTTSSGWFVEPTVFADVDNAMTIAREEIFGPVLCVIPYTGDDEAVAIANDSDYGLGGSVWSTDLDRAAALASRIRTGSVGINHYALDLLGPFGGVKCSGIGRELGPEGLSAYLSLKSIYSAPPPRRPATADTSTDSDPK
ncbi:MULTISPECIES: aldehyde dehydrogenase [unclassified Mycolicibacterium]|uniref:aldehyde dehydrogenase n=1 Tax=unclassified Mycolicibacterium TaxID=2636767 RepID=UPI0012DBD501|nr:MULTISPECIES: aldehyde dehydrogenase [unclassified Mycolicibacterium]MUL82325.1 aldehyde dehydrogenase [Mycolicibacterium sp. CBMA 329]MUL88091.1 aldehyde dehydrogenase [Mycolicibacterium sp. CBMA 331]MUM02421.1 aldehyde dehydrogenase [Mycolicibacterium sp. CBMA 334]MUM24824.1 aldehyde dehydrogenase [Mycolicibacterium sp. CBMA 295]MUM38388.1 aldehyde dehydrogenase [Mycolicibacterium sp. CBMA 247]